MSQRCFYVKTCLISLTVVRLFQPVDGRSSVQMGDDIWELQDELCFQTEKSSLCFDTHHLWPRGVSGDVCVCCNALTLCHAENSCNMYPVSLC